MLDTQSPDCEDSRRAFCVVKRGGQGMERDGRRREGPRFRGPRVVAPRTREARRSEPLATILGWLLPPKRWSSPAEGPSRSASSVVDSGISSSGASTPPAGFEPATYHCEMVALSMLSYGGVASTLVVSRKPAFRSGSNGRVPARCSPGRPASGWGAARGRIVP